MRLYKQIFTSYVHREEYHLRRRADRRPRHFLQASTHPGSQEEHLKLLKKRSVYSGGY
jgi:hypothetical protein